MDGAKGNHRSLDLQKITNNLWRGRTVFSRERRKLREDFWTVLN